jgi:hypothetical protein
MATYLLTCLRDPTVVAHYLQLGYLRIEHRLFGIHANDTHLLLSVIGNVPQEIPDDLLAQCAAIVAPTETAPSLPMLSPAV